MKKRKTILESAAGLELFLDPISCAFGGVIFITILVCVLLQNTGRAVQKVEDAGAGRISAFEQKRLMDEIARLQAIKSSIGRQLPASDPDPALVERYRALLAEKAILEQELAALGGAPPDDEPRRRARSELELLKLELARLAPRLEAARAAVAAAGRQDPVRVHLPRLQEPAAQGGGRKAEVGILLSQGRMVFLHTYDARGAAAQNEAEAQFMTAGTGERSVRAKPGAGIAIPAAGQDWGALDAALRRFDADRQFFVVAVWPDSFGEFERLRDRILDLRYGYGLMLVKQDGAVALGREGTGEQGGGK